MLSHMVRIEVVIKDRPLDLSLGLECIVVPHRGRVLEGHVDLLVAVAKVDDLVKYGKVVLGILVTEVAAME